MLRVSHPRILPVLPVVSTSPSHLSLPKMARKSTRIAAIATVAKPPPPPTTTTKKQPPSTSTSTSPPSPILHFTDPQDWASWITAQHQHQDQGITSSGAWLKIAKKASSIPSITYEQALDTALCHGWIDGQRKSFTSCSPAPAGDFFIQRFTPRRKASLWSKRNVDKVAALVAAGKMQPRGLAEINAAKADGRWDRAYAGSSEMEVPLDLEEALNGTDEAAKRARMLFDGLTKSKRYSMLWKIETAKTNAARKKRIDQAVQMLADGKV